MTEDVVMSREDSQCLYDNLYYNDVSQHVPPPLVFVFVSAEVTVCCRQYILIHPQICRHIRIAKPAIRN